MSNESSAIAADAYSWRLPPNNIQHFTEAQKRALYGLILALCVKILQDAPTEDEGFSCLAPT